MHDWHRFTLIWLSLMQFIKKYGRNIDRYVFHGCQWWRVCLCVWGRGRGCDCVPFLLNRHIKTRQPKRVWGLTSEKEKNRTNVALEKLAQKWNYSCRCDWCHIIYLFSMRAVCVWQSTHCTSNQVIKYCLHNNFSAHAIWLLLCFGQRREEKRETGVDGDHFAATHTHAFSLFSKIRNAIHFC